MIVLDTSFLVSFFLSSDVNHEKALKLAMENQDEEMLLSDIILFETLTVLNYKDGIALAKEAYEELASNRKVRIFNFTEPEKQGMMMEFFDQKNKLSFPDVSVIHLANKMKLKALAFDDKILKLSKSKKW